MRFLAAALFVMGLQTGAHAQEDTIFTYQGRLNDGAGPANGAYDLKFSIYDSTNQPGVLIAGPLTNFTVSVTNGLFTVPLDFGVEPFDGSDRWLEIAVRTNGAGSFTALTTRQQFTLTPYAIMSRAALFAVSNFTVGATLYLPPTNSTIYSGNESLLRWDSYEENVFVGPDAGAGGQANTAVGKSALANGSVGSGNSAFGDGALSAFLGGYANTAIGSEAMSAETNGNDNTALGTSALGGFSAGGSNSYNTAEGFLSLASLTSGNNNTANGADTMLLTTSGGANTANGAFALLNNTNGGYNVAVGYQALYTEVNSFDNTAVGENALYSYNGVGYNTALGDGALQLLISGNDNIGIGDFGGYNLTTGSWNIHIGNPGTSSDDHTIKIGQQGTQNKTFIAGISGTSVSGASVYVNSSGQLGATSPAFIQTASAGNTFNISGIGDATEIDNPLCNGKPNAILIAVHNLSNSEDVNLGHSYTVLYWVPDSKWVIASEGGSLSAGMQFNVVVYNF